MNVVVDYCAVVVDVSVVAAVRYWSMTSCCYLSWF